VTDLDYSFKPRDCYRSDGVAKQTYTRKQAKSRAKMKGSGLVAYRCPYCPHWHCASKNQPRSIP
jgi:hypothetical protein